MRMGLLLCLLALCVGGCSTLGSVFSDTNDNEEKQESVISQEGFIAIMPEEGALKLDPGIFSNLRLPEAAHHPDWGQENGDALGNTGHISGSTLGDVVRRATIGEGHDWIPAAIAPSAVVDAQTVYAMDGRGVMSAHARSDISTVLWVSDVIADDEPILAGGLALSGNYLLALSGRGTLAALDARNGNLLWKKDINAPVRSSLRVYEGHVFLISAQSQLLCYDTADGSLLWRHRAIGETDGLFGTTLPALFADMIAVAYPSGELFGLRLEDGSMRWNDVLSRPRRTIASGLYSGVDANPVTDGEVVYAASSNGVLSANDLKTGLRYWEIPMGTRHAPVVAGDALYAISHSAALVAIHRYIGKAAWMVPLSDEKQEERDTELRYYGPFLLNDTLAVLDAEGTLRQFDPREGKPIRTESLVSSVAASPSFAGDDAYLIGADATLYQVR